MATVTVRGEGSAPVTPIGVDVILTLEGDAEHPDEALDTVVTRTDVLNRELNDLDIPEEARTTVGARVAERFEYDRNADERRPVGYRASVVVVVSLEDASGVGPVLRAATARVGATADGPHWRIAVDDPAHARARAEAAASARRNAEAYADAFGLRLGALVSARDAREEVGYVLSGAARSAAEYLQVSPGQQTITAVVEATFELEGGG